MLCGVADFKLVVLVSETRDCKTWLTKLEIFSDVSVYYGTTQYQSNENTLNGVVDKIIIHQVNHE